MSILRKESFYVGLFDELEKHAGIPSALRKAIHTQQDAPGGRFGATRSLAHVAGKKMIPGQIAHEKEYPSEGGSAVPKMIRMAKSFRQEGREALQDVPKQTIKKPLSQRIEEGVASRGAKAGAALKERFGGKVESMLRKGREKYEAMPSPVKSILGSAAKGLLRGLRGEKQAAFYEGLFDELDKIANKHE